MFEAYLESVPFNLNVMAIPFGEIHFIGLYLKRISHLKCSATMEIFEKMGVLYLANTIVERGGEFREDNLISSE